MQRELGLKKAKKVLKEIRRNQQLNFINIDENELAKLTSVYAAVAMGNHRDVFSLRVASWVILIVDHDSFIEIQLIDPYEFREGYTFETM